MLKMVQWTKTLFRRILPAFAVKHPWVVITFFALVVAFFCCQLPQLYIDTDVTKLTTGSEGETRAIETAARDFTVGDPLYLVLRGDMDDPAVLQRAAEVIGSIRQVKDVIEVVSPFDMAYYGMAGFMVQAFPVAPQIPATPAEVEQFRSRLAQSPIGKRMISENSQAMLVEIYIWGSYSSRGKAAVKEIEQILKAKWGEDLFNMTGTCYLTHAMDQSIKRDVMLLFPLAAVVVVVFLILSFRSWLGFVIPGITVLVSLIVSVGLMAWLDYPLTIVSVVLPVIIIVVGSASAIHVLHKYREELDRQQVDKREAITTTMEQMVPPCAMAALTTAVGLFSLYTSTVIPVKDFGTFSGIGVLVSFLFTVIGIPALLMVFPVPRSKWVAARRKGSWDTVLLSRVAKWVVHNTKAVTVVGTVIVLLMVLGLGRITVEANIARYFRRSSAVAEGIRVYEEYFGGYQQALIVVDTNQPHGGINPEYVVLVDELEQYIQTFPLVSHTSSMASIARDVSPDGELHATLVPVAYQQLPQSLTSVYLSRNQQQKVMIYAWLRSSNTTQLAKTLVEMEEGLGQRVPEGVSVIITGLPKIVQHHMQRFSESQLYSTVASLAAVWLLLILFTGSFFEGFLSMVPLIFTIVVNFGIMGWFGFPLDAATVLLGSIALGMGIDYSIHFISRVHHEINAGRDLTAACEISISTAGHAIVINAGTLIAGFLMLCFSIFSTLSMFGVLMALAMGISCIATVTVLPAMLQALKYKLRRRVYHG